MKTSLQKLDPASRRRVADGELIGTCEQGDIHAWRGIPTPVPPRAPCAGVRHDPPLPQERTLLSGDLVEYDATPYAGDAYFQDWPQTLANIAALDPLALVPGRGPALKGPDQVRKGLDATRAFVADVYASVKAGASAGKDLQHVYRETYEKLKPLYGHWVIFDHCMPFDVTRAYDEAAQYPDPRVWTAERDRQMWETLES